MKKYFLTLIGKENEDIVLNVGKYCMTFIAGQPKQVTSEVALALLNKKKSDGSAMFVVDGLDKLDSGQDKNLEFIQDRFKNW